MKKSKTVLALLDKPEKWIKRYLGLDAKGFAVEGNDSRAVQWCLRGAVQKCYPVEQWSAKENIISDAIMRLYPLSDYAGRDIADIAVFNNDYTTTFAKIRRVLKLANV